MGGSSPGPRPDGPHGRDFGGNRAARRIARLGQHCPVRTRASNDLFGEQIGDLGNDSTVAQMLVLFTDVFAARIVSL